MKWLSVLSDDHLLAWKTAWDPQILRSDPVFMPSLLNNPDVRFLAATRGATITAGAVLNVHAAVVGISNFFSSVGDPRDSWRGCVSAAMSLFPGLPLVGYALGAELKTVLASGFGDLGPLRVWIDD